MIEQKQAKVGVGVMIMKDGKVLMAKRKGSHGHGEYSFPGGNLDYMESFEECAHREVAEEVGVEITNVRFLYLTNVKKYTPKHYVNIGLVADWASGEPQNLEPEKSEEWHWYGMDELVEEPMFEFCRLAIDAYKTGKTYYPAGIIEK